MKKTIYIGIAIIVLGGIALFVPPFNENKNAKQETQSAEVVDSTEYWANRIHEVGGTQAYSEFKSANAEYGINAQHTHAHIFGGAVYDALQLEGTQVCDSSFSFGCYHEYLGQAIHAHGIGSVEKLNDMCAEDLGNQALSCQHGIGHGVQSYFGYEEDDLLKALRVCADLPRNDPIGGCYGGAFMEYNMRTMLSLDGVGARAAEDTRTLHAPCDVVADDQLPACYYWQPQWWLSVFRNAGDDNSEAFEQMGTLCRELNNDALIRECFEGIGNIAPQSTDHDPEATVDLCKSVARTQTTEVYCRADAANSFHAVPTVRARASDVCDGLDGKEREYCIGFSTNTFNQLNAPPAIE